MASRVDATTWDDLPLSERARDVVHGLGWDHPTPIQSLILPQLAMRRDVIGRAQTGSGKTAAFGLYLVDEVAPPGLQALVLAPTRELATQITGELNRLAEGTGFRAVPVYGGVPYEGQLAALADPATTCVVATTGRLLDLLARKQVMLDKVRLVVLDEADRMLDLGFLPEVERVLSFIPGGRQTALFTATMPKKVAQLAHKYMSHPREVEVGAQTPASAEHYRIDVPSQHKLAALVALLDEEQPSVALVFTRTKDGAQWLARALNGRDERAVAFHGDLAQAQRERVVQDLKGGLTSVVVATDVAARGLDIPGITHVVNFDVPEEAEQYVHRAGRTARAGKAGRVFTLVTENDGRAVEAAERVAQRKLVQYPLTIETTEGPVDLAKRAPTPAKHEMRGGYARGVKAKNAPTRPNPLGKLVKERPDADPRPAGPEHDLPPSRRERKGRDEG